MLDAVNELIDELDGVQQQISEQALEHIHSNEVVLTLGYCRTVHLFLREAAKKRQFQVVVAEGGPSYEGQRMARLLADDGLQTTCITDSAVFAMMARANMVLLGAHAVLANGGMLGIVRARVRGSLSCCDVPDARARASQSGSHMVALAAQRHAVPVVVLCGSHKLAPVHPHDEDALNELRSPAEVLDFDSITDSLPNDGQGTGPDIHVSVPSLDYLSPQLLSLIISNECSCTPAYTVRLLSELFSQEDYDL